MIITSTSKWLVLVYAGYLFSVLPLFSLSLWLMTSLKYTDDAVIITLGLMQILKDEINRINLLSTPACRARTTSPLLAPKLFVVKLRLVRQTDLKNVTPSVARRHRLVLIEE